MKLRKLTAILLCALLLVGLLPTSTAASSSVNGYYNVDYLETEAAAAYGEKGLGAVYTPQATTWKLWSPTADHVQLRLYATGSDEEEGAAVLSTYSMAQNTGTGVWSLTLQGDYKNVYYTYLVTARGVTRETRDIYAKAAGVNGYRSMVVDLDDTDPVGWDNDHHVLLNESTDAVIWEIHVRDFSIDPSSGVSKDNRGKYLAFTEDDTTLNGQAGEVSTCVNYLKEMGVNTVHLLPVFDFGSVDETVTDDPTNRNWGYDPINYNVPEGSYSSDPYDGNTRITEFKEMVQALHEAGISVVMDVVYNHTYDLDNLQWGRVLINNAFNDSVPGYYFRMSGPSDWYNGSGCGNVTASDKLMYRKYMIESVRYWAEEYHIDGFRFDLMACHDVETMNLIRADLDNLDGGEGKKILMYGEPWTGGDAGIANGCTQDGAKNYGLNERIGLFCDWMRDAIKGNPDGDTKGWIQGDTSNAEAVRGGLSANDGRLTARSQTVTYADAHDNLILWDKLVRSNGGSSYTDYSSTSAQTWLKQLNLAKTIVLMSQGMAFNVAGTEFARNKQGDHNSYNAPDDINAIDWTVRKTNAAYADYYKGLIQIREAFSPITDPNTEYSKNYLSGNSDSCIAIRIPNSKAGEWSNLILILNNAASSATVTLPNGSWNLIADGSRAGLTSLGSYSGSYTVPGYGSAILVQQESNAGVNTISRQSAATQDYYLFGYINGANYACEEDYANLGIYKFENGSLTAAFNQDSYVAVKTSDSQHWYMTDGWLGTETSAATLYDTGKYPLGDNANKLFVPGNADINFTLTVNDDDTVTLSYTTGGGEVTPDPVSHTAEDKLILHCWNWSYDTIRQHLDEIKAAGYTAVQTSPAQPHSGYRTGEIPTGDWWMLYQPLGLHVAGENESWLGDADDLQALCAAAHEQGIEVIVDVVSNHLCNGYNDIEAGGVDPYDDSQIVAVSGDRKGYQFEIQPDSRVLIHNPELTGNKFRSDYIFCDDNSTEATVHGNIGMPDLKTEDAVVQGSVLNYLKELIDAGVDGFRFDAAKHIETPSDGTYASQFWPTVINGAEAYAESKGRTVWSYGEVLSTAGHDRKMNYYAPYIDMTEISYAYTITEGFGKTHSASQVANQQFKDWLGVGVETLANSDLVLMAESHDTYAQSEGSFSVYGPEIINKAWAVAAARANASALYFARPLGYTQEDGPIGSLGACEDYNWMDVEVAEANKFHTAFVGAAENVYSAGDLVVVERYKEQDCGAVIANAAGFAGSVSFTAIHLSDGTYYDQITGNEFTVSDGSVSGQLGTTGIAVLRKTAPVACEHPADQRYTVTKEATCTEDGYVAVYCNECGRMVELVSTTPALGHVDENKDQRCDRCNEFLGVITVYFVDSNDWVPANDYFTNIRWHGWKEGGTSTTWPGQDMKLVGRSTDNHGIWKVEMNPEKYEWIIFNAGENGAYQTVDIHYIVDAGDQNVLVYVADSASGGRSFDGTESLYINAAAVEWWRNDGAILTMTLNKGDGSSEVLTLSQAEGAIYGAVIPAGSYTSLVLSRVSPSDQTQVWNSTGAIPVPAQGNYINRFADGSAQASWGFWPSGSFEKVGVSHDKALREICGHTAYTIYTVNDRERWVCDCCGETYEPGQPETFDFIDVQNPDAYYYVPVYWACEKGITNGTGDNKFSPGVLCTRAQVVTFLYRAAGEPAPNSTTNPFSDIQPGSYYYNAVLWANEKGITNGTGGSRFSPNAVCSRAQVVTFLWRANGELEPTPTTNPFTDVEADSFYSKAVLWAQQQGITNGTGDGKFNPNASCTRAQVVTFLYRAYTE